MPRRTIRIDQFDRGLWVAGSKDSAPRGSLRRARGIHGVRTTTLRSRDGDQLLLNLTGAHSLYRFGDVRFQASSTMLYRNSSSILSGLNAGRLAFVRMPPTTGTADYLFIAGGGLARKVDSTGAVTTHGLTPPADGFTAALGTQQTKTIDNFETAAGWTATDCTLADEATIKLFDTNSMEMVIAGEDTVAYATKAISLDLTTYGGTASPLEDFIEVWVRVDEPQNVEYIDIQFDVSGGSFNTNFYHRRIFPTTALPVGSQSTAQSLGIADLPGINQNETIFSEEAVSESQIDTSQGLAIIAQTSLHSTPGAWTRLRIPKRLFERSGSHANGWANVGTVRLVVKTNGGGGATVYWDRARLIGSAGLQGNYKYHVTFRNSTTGTRSNGNPTAVTINNVERQPVELANLPVSADSQVNQREIWRTFGGGARFFRCAIISDNTTTTFTDTVADYAGLNSNSGVSVLEGTELPLDNDIPESTFGDAWGPHAGRIWWCKNTVAGTKGYVYYSPAGRAEAVQGFLAITDDDDPTQKGCTWNGANWVFTESRIFRIDNTTEPFLSREVFGAPGTSQPYTVVPTPFGIVYQSYDGIRIFDGVRSQLVFPDAIQVLMRGESVENLSAFEGVVAAYANNEYIISDLSQTLAVNLQTGIWRDLGVAAQSLYAEPDTGLVVMGLSGGVYLLESESIDNSPSFEIEIPSVDFGTVPTRLEAVRIDALVGSGHLAPTLLRDNATEVLPNMLAATRQLKSYSIGQMARIVGVRIVGSSPSQISIYSISFEVVDIPLYVLVNGRFITEQGIEGDVLNLSEGIAYPTIDEALTLANVWQVPEVRRLIVDANQHGESITPRLTFVGSTVDLPPLEHDGRRIYEWDVGIADRLVNIELLGDFETIQLYQVAVELHLGEAR